MQLENREQLSVLHIISSSYPYGTAEQPYETEIKELARYFDKIIIYPIKANGIQRALPQNTSVNNVLNTVDRSVTLAQFVRHSLFVVRIFTYEFFKSKRPFKALLNFRYSANAILQCYSLGERLIETVDKNAKNYYYSLWMNDGALIYSILKKRGKIDFFTFRVNGYDLFEERVKDGYMPLRSFNMNSVNRVISVSKFGADYLKQRTSFGNKVVWNFCSIYDKGTNPIKAEAVFTLVSCAALIGLKRIDKIIDALKLLNFSVKWIHFGDGPLRSQIEEMIDPLPSNISVHLKGNVSNSELMEFYRSNSINAFIHSSESEGLGLAIIEAQSFGIPAIAINSGAVCDIVNEETGILLPQESGPKEIANAILELRNGTKNTLQYRTRVKAFWRATFEAQSNYCELVDLIKMKSPD